MHRAAKLLQQSETVYVAGFRASLPVAYTLVYGYRLFRNSVQLIDGQNVGLEMQLRPIGKRDAVVVISFSPYSSEMLTIIEHAKRRGARLLAMTDSDASPLARAADQTILFSIDSPSFFLPLPLLFPLPKRYWESWSPRAAARLWPISIAASRNWLSWADI